MKIIVCGGRDYKDHKTLNKYLDDLHAAQKLTMVIDGGARGADHLARDWAAARGVTNVTYWANWEGDGKGAGPVRNKRMLDLGKPDRVVAFPGGPGTADMVRQAQMAWVPVVEVK